LGSATQPHSAIEVGGWLLSFLPTSASWQTIGKSNGPAAVFTRILAAANTAHAKALDADGLVAIGGGSTIGLGKALALRAGLPLVAVPTTYAGSEMTSILGETEGARKTTQRSEKVRPRTVIYDVELTLSLPAGLSATSGINALAHAVEALYAQDGNPIVSLMAEEGIAALGRSLPHIVSNPSGDMAARSVSGGENPRKYGGGSVAFTYRLPARAGGKKG